MSENSSSSAPYVIPWYPEDCVFGIRLTVQMSSYEAGGRAQGYRMRLEVPEARGLDPNIFVFRVLLDAHDQTPYGRFDRVASPNDLEEYPAGVPQDWSDVECFRLAEVDLVFRSDVDRQAALDAIRSECDELILTLENLCRLDISQEFVIGELEGSSSAPVEGSSSGG